MSSRSIIQLKQKLRPEIEHWAENYEIGLTFDEIQDLLDSLVEIMEDEILEVFNLPETVEDDDEHGSI